MPEVATTLINSQTTIKGEITFAGPAIVQGRIEGQITSQDALEIGVEASVAGDIVGSEIDIQGTVRGNVTASRTARLGAQAKLTGELRATNLAIAEGATFVGRVYVGAQLPVEEQASSPAATLHSRLTALADSGEEQDELLRVASHAVTNALKRNPVIIKAAR